VNSKRIPHIEGDQTVKSTQKTLISLSFALALVAVLLAVGASPALADGPPGPKPNSKVIYKLNPIVNLYHVPPPPPRDPNQIRVQAVSFDITFDYAGCDTSGGKTYAPWPAEAQAAFQYAANQWSALLNGTIPIKVHACWRTNLPFGVLGQASHDWVHAWNFTGEPIADSWYPTAMADQLQGSDTNPTEYDIDTAFSSTFPWYYGTDGSPGGSKVDFVSVVMHELGHGLGFDGLVTYGSYCGGSNYGCWGLGSGYPGVYERFTETGSGQQLISAFPNNSAALGSQLTSNNLYFDGTYANAANGGTRPKIYAPNPWSGGSSYAHLDYDTFHNTPNMLMIYALSYGESAHNPGPVTLGIFQDMGWNVVGADPPDAPSLLSATAASQTQINLSWTDNSDNETGFKVQRSPNGTSGWTQIGTAAANATSYQDTGLSCGTAYYYRVLAYNVNGDSDPSNTANDNANACPPDAPTGLGATAVSQTQIDLDWTDNSSDETGFKIERSPNGTSGWAQIGTVGAGVTSYSDTGLTCSTGYYYRVRAYNANGDSDPSNTANTSTDICPPTGLSASAVSSTQIDLSWTDNSGDEDGFKIERSPNGTTGWTQIGTVGADVTSYSDTGRTCGTSYYYRVRAYRGTDDSDYSNTDNTSTVCAPTVLSATAATQTQINLSWTDNSGDEEGFKIERSPNGSSGWAQIATVGVGVTTYSDTGLTCSTSYYYRVRAYRGTDNSDYSNTANDETNTCPPPDAPTGLSATAASQTQIDLSWTDNSDNETGFKIERSPNGTTGWTQIGMVGADVTSYNDTGRTCSTAYYYRVRAYHTSYGDSSYSNTANTSTDICPPTGLSATAASQTQIDLSWTDNSGDEDGFKIERSPNGTSGWAQIGTVGADVTAYNDTGLTCGTTYYYRVRAYRATDDSDYSNMANTPTNTCAPPNVPSGLIASAVSQTQINLSWTDNDTVEDGFKIERSHNGTDWTQIATVGTNITTYSDSDGLGCEGTYHYRVRAYNSYGDSGYSNTDDDTTNACTGPAAPSGLSGTAASSTQIDLTWTDNSGDELGFRIERSLNGEIGWTQIAEVGSNVTSYSDNGLTPGTTYYYRVRAYHAGGNSAYSSVASASAGFQVFLPMIMNKW
jgi:hypothetical protein